ncbi:hypothetical protein AUJ14_05435 [Candidatus Micrarchaeota archaeon CG1_02_55_22]|nr:MAG: hypothetical protein AUJ14_05435 [Candidatus Micrarchaeota archaeon CG1_02_55_22]
MAVNKPEKPALNAFKPVKLKLDCGVLELRLFCEGDAEPLNGIFCNPSVNAGLLFEPCTLAESQRYFAEEAAKGRASVVAVLDGRVVGNISFRPCAGRSLHVTGFGIMFSPSVHGKGVASAALDAVFNHWRKAGFEIVRGDVFSSNARARAFYKKLGFEEVGVAPRVAKFTDGHYDDEVVIVKRL